MRQYPPCGRLMISVSVSGDKTVRVWDVRTGALLAGLQCSYRGITSVDFQPASPYDETVAPAFPRSGTILKGTIVAGSADATINIFHLVAVSHSAVHIVDALDMVPPVRDMTFSEMLVDEDAVRVETARSPDHSDDDDDRAEDEIATGEPELRIELQRVCWASCVCPPGRSRPDGAPCWRCQSHTDLVRSLQIKDSVILSGGYDSTVKASSCLRRAWGRADMVDLGQSFWQAAGGLAGLAKRQDLCRRWRQTADCLCGADGPANRMGLVRGPRHIIR